MYFIKVAQIDLKSDFLKICLTTTKTEQLGNLLQKKHRDMTEEQQGLKTDVWWMKSCL